MAIPLNYSLRGLWVRRTTALATTVGIALVVFVLAASLMLAAGLEKTLIQAGSNDKAIVMQVDAYSESDSRLKQAVLTVVAAAPGVKKDAAGLPLVTGEVVVHVTLSRAHDPSRMTSLQVRGISPNAFELRPQVRIVQGRKAKPGTDEAIVGSKVFGQYRGLAIGEGFELQKKRRVTIVGAFEADGGAYESEVWADLDTVRSSLGSLGYLSSVTAQLTSERAFEAFALMLQQDKRQGLTAQREKFYYQKMSQYLGSVITGLGGVVTLIFSFGAMLGATITMYGAVNQRRREVGVLRALGFSRGHVLLAVMLESTVLALIGGVSGAGLALLTCWLDFSTMNFATGQELVFRFSPSLTSLGSALLLGVWVGVVGGFFPALRAASVTPVQAMRG